LESGSAAGNASQALCPAAVVGYRSTLLRFSGARLRTAMSSGLWHRQYGMRIAISEFISLDGVVQAPGGPDEDTDGGFALWRGIDAGSWDGPRDASAGNLGSNAGSWDRPPGPARRRFPRRPNRRGKLGSPRPSSGPGVGGPISARDRTREVGITLPDRRAGHSMASQPTREVGIRVREVGIRMPGWRDGSVGPHGVRTYKCVCGDLLKFGSGLSRAVLGSVALAGFIARGSSGAVLIWVWLFRWCWLVASRSRRGVPSPRAGCPIPDNGSV
jgi:hypothetical protein